MDTENGVIVTKSLIEITLERLEMLKPFLRRKLTKKKGDPK